MNWNYWLPWRSVEQNDDKDSTYESEVKERCDHDFEQTRDQLLDPNFSEATIDSGLLVVPQYEVVEEFCEKCGEPGYKGELHPYESSDYTYLAPYNGKWTRVAHRLAFEPAYEVDPDVSLSNALSEPVEADADIVVDEDGEAEVVEDDEDGRILVSQGNHDADFDVTD